MYQSTGSGSPEKEPVYYSSGGDPPRKRAGGKIRIPRATLSALCRGLAEGPAPLEVEHRVALDHAVEELDREDVGAYGRAMQAWRAAQANAQALRTRAVQPSTDSHEQPSRPTLRERRSQLRGPARLTARPRERRPGSTRSTTSRRTRSTASAQSADPPAAEPPSAHAVDAALILLGFHAERECQQRAFLAAVPELQDLLVGDRLTDEDLETFVEMYRYDDWPSEWREQFGAWLVEHHTDLFTRPANGGSRLHEPVMYGPWLEPLTDDERPF